VRYVRSRTSGEFASSTARLNVTATVPLGRWSQYEPGSADRWGVHEAVSREAGGHEAPPLRGGGPRCHLHRSYD
jgi:hypothetical protein